MMFCVAAVARDTAILRAIAPLSWFVADVIPFADSCLIPSCDFKYRSLTIPASIDSFIFFPVAPEDQCANGGFVLAVQNKMLIIECTRTMPQA